MKIKLKLLILTFYEDYKERFDKDCNVACSNISRNFTLKEKLPGRKKKELILQPYINKMMDIQEHNQYTLKKTLT